MRNLKKFLALVLVFMMAMSLMVTANAATTSNKEFTDSNDVHEAFWEDLVVVNGMGVIKGFEDDTFKPNATITRAQMAAIVYRMATGDVEDKYDSNFVGYVGRFTDKNLDPETGAYAWASGYIGYCANAEYIVGYPDGTFHPEKEVTGYQALAMILRAMGYNHPGNNFTGDDWATRTSEIADRRGMLVNIDKTSFGSALRVAAPRQVVAEMAFQGLTKAQVQWTNSYGYQTTGMDGYPGSGTQNPSLGYTNFGLTNHKGIVVGNQGSGETVTKVGFSLDVAHEKGLNVGDDWSNAPGTSWMVTGSVTGAKFNDTLVPEAYYYGSSLAVNTAGNGVNGNVTLSFKWDSDLKLFNHAVDVWYDCRANSETTTETASLTGIGGWNAGSVSFPSNLNTYAMFDRTKPENIKVATATWDVTTADTSMVDVFGATADTLYNYAFAPMQRAANGTYDVEDFGNTNTMPTKSDESPIQANNGSDTYVNTATTDPYPLYLAIDNTGNGAADVIITLNLTMTKVVQDNNTQAPFTTGVLSQNGAGTGYFDLWDQKTPANGTPDYSDIADAHLLNSDGTTLGKYVSAMTITGTAPTQNDGTQDTAAAAGAMTVDGTEGNASITGLTGINSTYYYQVNELKDYVTGTMVKYDQNTDKVWVTVNGELKEIERSVFALATDGSFQANEKVFAPRNSGTYRFYLDEAGKWIFWEQDSSTAKFVYGTYINYTTNEFGGLFNYPFVYVDDAGTAKQTGYVTYLDMNSVNGPLGTTFTGDMQNAGYTAVQLPKRTNTGDNSSGFVPGAYVGYTMTKNDKNEVTLDADVTTTNFRQATTAAGNFGEAGETTTINSTSVALTAHPVTNAGNLFLTNRTTFVIVDGAGTETQKVDIYKGLADLLGDNQSVTIDATTALTATTAGSFLKWDAPECADPWQMVYYSTEEDPYSQDYYQMDKHIDTVFIPKQLVTWTAKPTSGNLWFVGDNTHGLIDAGTDATQFTFHQGTDSQVLWIAGQYGGTNARAVGNANVVGNATNKDTFYWLFDTGEKAKDGAPIYTINTAAQTPGSANTGLIGYYYAGTNVADPANPVAGLRTKAAKDAITLGDAAGTTYLATTRDQQVAYIGGRAANTDLYNVQNATILNLNKAYTINSLADLNLASSNTSNKGIAVSCVLGDSPNVANIYVNFVPGT